MNIVKRKRLFRGLIILSGIVPLLSGCALLSRFQPNTLVKDYRVISKKPKIGGYNVTILMQAREIGNRTGIDDYRIIFQFKSNKAISKTKDSLALPIPRITSLKITSATDEQFEVLLDRSRLDNRKLSDPPQIFRSHYFEYFNVKDVSVPNELSVIKIDATVEFYDRRSLESDSEAGMSVELEKSESMEWYKPRNTETDNE